MVLSFFRRRYKKEACPDRQAPSRTNRVSTVRTDDKNHGHIITQLYQVVRVKVIFLKKRKKRPPQEYALRDFDRVKHRYYFLLDLPPEEAFQRYCQTLRITESEALADLTDLSQKKIKGIQKCYEHTKSFKYRHTLEEKFKYIEEIKEQWQHTTTNTDLGQSPKKHHTTTPSPNPNPNPK